MSTYVRHGIGALVGKLAKAGVDPDLVGLVAQELAATSVALAKDQVLIEFLLEELELAHAPRPRVKKS